MDTKSFLPYVEKYRPSEDWSQFVGVVAKTIEKLEKAQYLPHLLFVGPPGSGKNSCIQALFKKIFGPLYTTHIRYINASQDRGIDAIRNQINLLAQINNRKSKLPYIIVFDEADNLTDAAQNALRQSMEKLSKNCRFCFLCNRSSSLNPAILSRTEKYYFPPLSVEETCFVITRIAKAEKIQIEQKEVTYLATLCRGDLRYAINQFQSASVQSQLNPKIKVTMEDIIENTGDLSSKEWQQLIHLPSEAAALKLATSFFQRSVDFKILLKKIQDYILFEFSIKEECQEKHLDFLIFLSELESPLTTCKPLELLFATLIVQFQKNFSSKIKDSA